MVNMGELFANPRLIQVDMDRVPLNQKEKNSSLLAPGDLLFARQSLVLAGAGKCSIFVRDDEDVCFESHVIRCRLDKGLADPNFYFYFFGSHAGRKLIETIVEQGAGASGIRGSDLAELPVPWVDLTVQKWAAGVLSQIDDKIAANRRINQTLETMAQAIFKSWFVDFDPVKAKIVAKAEGRDPLRAAMCTISGKADAELDALPPEQQAQLSATAALFSDETEESELGEIPKGWAARRIGDVISRVAMGPFGSDIKKANFVDAGVPVIRGGNLTAGLVEDRYVFLTESKADELKNANAFPGDIVITHRGTLGQVGLIPVRSKFPRYVVSQSQMLLSADRDIMSSRYLFEFLRSDTGKQQLLSNTSQVGVPAIARPTGSVKALPLVVPLKPVLDAYDNALQPLLLELTHLTNSSRTLVELRDALLPKLISGELQVQNSEAEAAA